MQAAPPGGFLLFSGGPSGRVVCLFGELDIKFNKIPFLKPSLVWQCNTCSDHQTPTVPDPAELGVTACTQILVWSDWWN